MRNDAQLCALLRFQRPPPLATPAFSDAKRKATRCTGVRAIPSFPCSCVEGRRCTLLAPCRQGPAISQRLTGVSQSRTMPRHHRPETRFQVSAKHSRGFCQTPGSPATKRRMFLPAGTPLFHCRVAQGAGGCSIPPCTAVSISLRGAGPPALGLAGGPEACCPETCLAALTRSGNFCCTVL